ncbi:MAG: hypothetical protein HRU09_05225 [Oligoflexales bacterium]|nr:hypothetical protein [Oligoflexales bacterium]
MDCRQTVRYLICLSMLLISSALVAKELRWTHFGLRPLAMGNAYVAVADDYNALFYNPAGLARLEEWDGEFLNPTLEIGKSTVDFINELLELPDGSLEQTSDVLDLFQDQTGKIHHMAAYFTPHLIFKHFGIGIGLSLPFSLVAHSNINIEFEAGLRMVAPISFAMNFLEDRLSVGGSLKVLARGGIDADFTIQTLSALSDSGDDSDDSQSLEDFIEGGSGVGVDVGMLFTPIKTMEPTFGLSITDLGGTPFEKMDVGGTAIGVPEARLPSVNTGFSIKPIKTDRMYVLAALDAHMINQPVHYSHKLNAGLEWGFSKIIKVQTGLKEGYLTAGFQFDVGLLNLRFATYAVDHAPVVGTHDDLAERRYTMQLKLLI